MATNVDHNETPLDPKSIAARVKSFALPDGTPIDFENQRCIYALKIDDVTYDTPLPDNWHAGPDDWDILKYNLEVARHIPNPGPIDSLYHNLVWVDVVTKNPHAWKEWATALCNYSEDLIFPRVDYTTLPTALTNMEYDPRKWNKVDIETYVKWCKPAPTTGKLHDWLTKVTDLVPGTQLFKTVFNYIKDKMLTMLGFIKDMAPVKSVIDAVKGTLDTTVDWLSTSVVGSMVESIKKMFGKVCGKALGMGIAFAVVICLGTQICRLLKWSANCCINLLANVLGIARDWFDWMKDWWCSTKEIGSDNLEPELEEVQASLDTFDESEPSRIRVAIATTKAIAAHGIDVVKTFVIGLYRRARAAAGFIANAATFIPRKIAAFIWISEHADPALRTAVKAEMENDVESKGSNYGILHFIFGLASACYFGKWPTQITDMRDALSFVRMMGSTIFVTKQIETILDVFVHYLPGFLAWVNVTHMSKSKKATDMIAPLKSNVAKVINDYNAGNLVKPTEEQRKQITLLMDLVEQAVYDLGHPANGVLMREMISLQQIFRDTKTGSRKRVEPVAVRLWSAPGVGKTSLLEDLVMDATGDESFFHVPQTTFWDGITQDNSNALIFDEFAMDSRILPEQIGQIIQVVSSGDFKPPLAFESKNGRMGKGVSIAPTLVVTAGNVGAITNVQGISDMSAFLRRIDFSFEVSVIPEYHQQSSDGSQVPNYEAIKRDIASGKRPPHFLETFGHLRFRSMIVGRNSIFKARTYRYEEIIELIQDKMDQKLKRFNEGMARRPAPASQDYLMDLQSHIPAEYVSAGQKRKLTPAEKLELQQRFMNWCYGMDTIGTDKEDPAFAEKFRQNKSEWDACKFNQRRSLFDRLHACVADSSESETSDTPPVDEVDEVRDTAPRRTKPGIPRPRAPQPTDCIEKLLKARMNRKQQRAGLNITLDKTFDLGSTDIYAPPESHWKNAGKVALSLAGLYFMVPKLKKMLSLPKAMREEVESAGATNTTGTTRPTFTMAWARDRGYSPYGPTNYSRFNNLKETIVKLDCPCFQKPRYGFYLADGKIVSHSHGACLDSTHELHLIRGSEETTITSGEWSQSFDNEDNDIVIYNVPPGCLGVIKQVKAFADGYSKNQRMLDGMVLVWFPDEQGDGYSCVYLPGHQKRVSIRDGDVCWMQAGYEVSFPVVKGWCGMPSFVIGNNNQIRYLGPIVGGTRDTTPRQHAKTILAPYHPTTVTEEMVAAGEEAHEPVGWYVPKVLPDSVHRMKDDLDKVRGEDMEVWVSQRPVPSAPVKSALVQSEMNPVLLATAIVNHEEDSRKDEEEDIPQVDLLEFIKKNDSAPACLRENDKRTDPSMYGKHPATRKLSVLATARTKTPHNIKLAADILFEEIAGGFRAHGSYGRTLTRDEAILGVEARVPSMDLTTAVGWPLVNHPMAKNCPGKRAFVDRDVTTQEVFYTEPFLKDYARYEKWRSGGEPVEEYVMGYCKDEILPSRKIKSKDTRLIWCCSMTYLTALKMEVGWLTTLFANHWDSTFCLMGVDLQGPAMNTVVSHLARWSCSVKGKLEAFDAKICCGDFKSFDLNMNEGVLEEAWELIGRFCDEFIHGFDMEWFRKLKNSLMNATFLVGGLEFKKRGFNASGNLETTLINCLVNKLLFYSWVLDCGLSPLNDFRHWAGGDDNIWSVNPTHAKAQEQLTPTAFQKWCSEHGFQYSPADKTAEFNEENSFVHPLDIEIYGMRPVVITDGLLPVDDDMKYEYWKHNWERMPLVGRLLPERFYKSAVWKKKTTANVEHTMSVLNNCAWYGAVFKENIRMLCRSMYDRHSEMVAAAYPFLEQEVRLLQEGGCFSQSYEAKGDEPAPPPAVLPTIAPENLTKPLLRHTEPGESVVEPGVTSQPFSSVDVGGPMAHVATPPAPETSEASFSSGTVDQFAALASWQKRFDIIITPTFRQTYLCPYGLLALGGGSDPCQNQRGQLMGFSNFAYSRGTIEIAFMVPGQAFFTGGVLITLRPWPGPYTGTPSEQVPLIYNGWGMEKRLVCPLSATRRYEIQGEYEFQATAFSNVAGLDLAEEDENNWELVVEAIPGIPANQSEVTITVYTRFTDFVFSLPRIQTNPAKTEIQAIQQMIAGKRRVESVVAMKWRAFTPKIVEDLLILMEDEGEETCVQLASLAQTYLPPSVATAFWRVTDPKREYVATGHSSSKSTNNTYNIIGTAEDANIQNAASSEATATGPEIGIEASLPMHHPTHSTAVIPTYPVVPPMANTMGGTYCQTMNFTGNAPVRQEKVFTRSGESTFRSICQRERLVQTGNFTTTDPAGTLLFDREFAIDVRETDWNNHYSGYATDIANHFLKWKGDMIFKIYFFGNKFQKITLQAFMAYGADVPPEYENIDQQVSHQFVLSTENPVVEIKVPYNSQWPHLFVKRRNTVFFDPILNTSCGFFGVYTAGILTTTTEYPAAPYVMTMRWDVDFFHPLPTSLSPITVSAAYQPAYEAKGPEPMNNQEEIMRETKVVLAPQKRHLLGPVSSLGRTLPFETSSPSGYSELYRRFSPMRVSALHSITTGETNLGCAAMISVEWESGDTMFAGWRGSLNFAIRADKDFTAVWVPGVASGTAALDTYPTVFPVDVIYQYVTAAYNWDGPIMVQNTQTGWSVDVNYADTEGTKSNYALNLGALGAWQESKDKNLYLNIPWVWNQPFRPVSYFYSGSSSRNGLILIISKEETIKLTAFRAGARDFQVGRFTGTTGDWRNPIQSSPSFTPIYG
jgi:hypothetical protein